MERQNIRLILFCCLLGIFFLLLNFWLKFTDKKENYFINEVHDKNIFYKKNKNFTDKKYIEDEKKNTLFNENNVLKHDIYGEKEKNHNINYKLFFNNRIIKVYTDVFSLSIDLLGGDIVSLKLNKYPIDLCSKEGYNLLDISNNKYFILQSGMLGEKFTDSHRNGRVLYTTDKKVNILYNNTFINVDLLYESYNGIKFIKRFKFKPYQNRQS